MVRTNAAAEFAFASAASGLLDGCRCVTCGGDSLDWQGEDGDGAVRCQSCDASYDAIDGIPYLLVLEPRDFMALVEIAGEFGSPHYLLDRIVPYDGTWGPMLAAYDAASDKEAFRATLGAKASGIGDRHEQWREMQILAADLELAGRNVLVVGAGLGFDTHLILERGARVTAVDLNPQMNSIGRRQTPQARWIGALGRRLPFVDGWFDHVFISASLHHVLDVSATIVEMLRVLKRGGSLITTNDSYMSDAVTDAEDAHFWNDHLAVLRGINENRPRLKTLIDPLLERRDHVDVEFWTSRAYAVLSDCDEYEDFLEPRRWDLWSEHPKLRRSSGGGVFMRVVPKVAIQSPLNPPAAPIIRPMELSHLAGDKGSAMARIAQLIPPELLPPPFPGADGNTKFQLLNGWRWMEPGAEEREAYGCGRWYMVRGPGADWLEVSARAKPAGNAPDPTLEIVVDGRVEVCRLLPRGKVQRSWIELSQPAPGTPFCVEVRLSDQRLPLDQGLIVVETLKLASSEPRVRLEQVYSRSAWEIDRLAATRAQLACERAQRAEQRAYLAEQQTTAAKLRADLAEQRLATIMASKSWQLTQPLRRFISQAAHLRTRLVAALSRLRLRR